MISEAVDDEWNCGGFIFNILEVGLVHPTENIAVGNNVFHDGLARLEA